MARALCVLAVCCLCTVAPAAPNRRRWQLSQADAAAMSSADAASVAAVLLELSGGGGGGGSGALRGSSSGALRAADVSLAPPPEEGASSGEDAAATTGAPSKTAKTPKCPKTKRGVCNGSGDCDEACVCRLAPRRTPARARPLAPSVSPFLPSVATHFLARRLYFFSLQHGQVHMQGELGRRWLHQGQAEGAQSVLGLAHVAAARALDGRLRKVDPR